MQKVQKYFVNFKKLEIGMHVPAKGFEAECAKVVGWAQKGVQK